MADNPDLAAAQAAVAKAGDALNAATHLQANDQAMVNAATAALKAATDKLAADQAAADNAASALDAATAAAAADQQTITTLQTRIDNLPADQDAAAEAAAAVQAAKSALAAAGPDDIPAATAALTAAQDALAKADAAVATGNGAPAALATAQAALAADTETVAKGTANRKTADDAVSSGKAAVDAATGKLSAAQAAAAVPLAQDAAAIAKATAELATAKQTLDQILGNVALDPPADPAPAPSAADPSAAPPTLAPPTVEQAAVEQAALDTPTTASDTANSAPALQTSVIQVGESPAGSMRFIDTMADAQAARLYRAAFGRVPDDAGLAWWTSALRKGASLLDIARGFVASAEFQARYSTTDNAGLVTGFYENVLGRAPDASGIAYWTDALDRKTANAAQVLVGFSECIENKAHTPDAQTASVARLYYATLDRAPDAAGLTFWTSRLVAQAATLVDEATALADSPEFKGHYGNLGDAAFVGQLYENVLGRPADAAGLATWTQALAHGASRGNVVTSFSESAEFKDRFVTTTAQNGIPLG